MVHHVIINLIYILAVNARHHWYKTDLVFYGVQGALNDQLPRTSSGIQVHA